MQLIACRGSWSWLHMGVMGMGNSVPRVGLKPTSLDSSSSVLPLHQMPATMPATNRKQNYIKLWFHSKIENIELVQECFHQRSVQMQIYYPFIHRAVAELDIATWRGKLHWSLRHFAFAFYPNAHVLIALYTEQQTLRNVKTTLDPNRICYIFFIGIRIMNKDY